MSCLLLRKSYRIYRSSGLKRPKCLIIRPSVNLERFETASRKQEREGSCQSSRNSDMRIALASNGTLWGSSHAIELAYRYI